MLTVTQFVLFALIISATVGQQDICPDGADYWPDVDDCNSYYDCRGSTPIRQQCSEGLYWNHPLTTCDYPENVPECVGGTRPPIGGTTTTTQTTTRPTTTPITERTTTGGPDPTTSGTTTVISTIPTTSPTTTTTNAPIGDCPPDGEHQLPYPGDCSIYIKCVQGFPILLRCPVGTLFDTRERICKPESVAVCDVRLFYRTQV